MKRLRRIILNVLTALSLLLCVALAGMWMRSYSIITDVAWVNAAKSQALGLTYSRGQLVLIASRKPSSDNSLIAGFQIKTSSRAAEPQISDLNDPKLWQPEMTRFRWGGFAYAVSIRKASTGHFFMLPFWMPVILCLALPLSWLIRWRARWRREGSCPTCNYDLRATPDRCPECGTIPAKAKA